MNTEKRTKMVELIYWTCENPDHNHSSQRVAEACIAKANKPKHVTNVWTFELYRSALARYEAGETLTALGKEFGVSCARMRQVVNKATRLKLGGN